MHRSRPSALATLCCTVLLFAACSGEPPPKVEDGGVMVLAPASADPVVARLVAALEKYLTTLSGSKPQTSVADLKTDQQVVDTVRKARAGLAIVVDAHTMAPGVVTQAMVKEQGAQGFRIVTRDLGEWSNRLGSSGATFLYLSGKSKLATQYAVYEVLRRLGARFYHPEQEHLPKNDPLQLRPRARTPTVIARKGTDGKPSDLYLPDFAFRSYSFHGAHPMPQIEALSDASHPFDEAERLNDWIVKNRGNLMRGSMSGTASADSKTKRVAQLESLRKLLGFPRGAGITLHNQQQGASAVVDRSSSKPARQQIEEYVARRLAAVPDAISFGVHFGPTEFTVTPDKETVDWINWAGRKALELKPGIRVVVNNHITGSQAVDNMSDLGCPPGTNEGGKCDYYDLAFHTDRRFFAKVHTVMFYPLEGPAPVYNQRSFSHKLCLMRKASTEGRPLEYFPEGSWWLSFDNTIPVYLPLYIYSRHRDVELLRSILKSRGGGTLDSHRMFNSGHEWGYWQQDYAVGLLHWNADITIGQSLAEMLDPLCPPKDWKGGCDARTKALGVMLELIAHQKEYLLLKKDWRGMAGGLFTYLSGEDPADEIAAVTGFAFRPVRVSFATVARWPGKKLKEFRDTDMKALATMEGLHKGWLDRLKALESTVPGEGRSWLGELIDGIENNLLRVRQARQLYEAVLVFRETALDNEEKLKADPKAVVPDPAEVGKKIWQLAAETLNQAEKVIRRREGRYRYPAKQMFGGGLTTATAVPNGTTYPWRLYTKTHLLTYWRNRHEQVQEVLAGKTASTGLTMEPVFASPGAQLSLKWPAVKDLKAEISIGKHKVGHKDLSVDLGPGEGFFPVSGYLQTGGRRVNLSGGVARAKDLSRTPPKGFKVAKPKSSLAQNVLNSLLPGFLWAYAPGSPATLAFAPDLDGDGKAGYSQVIGVAVTTSGSGFESRPVDFTMPIPDPSTGLKALTVRLTSTVVSGRFSSGLLTGPVTMKGQMSLQDLVTGLIQLAGFDEKGAYQTLAGILGFDPNKPPKTVEFEAELKIERKGG